ncbi:MAG: F0F1 ATP synthase subunit B, F-type H+-transporting ATPase subunit b [Parcubacteria group bacterium GW2011_GWC1_36_108]|nr:MAG: F0F1 ATP synthase subunit B, F-type H+-transporting ATPase subunit b [Parcubacteria group bacterium GW2011_GWC1_36_108]HBU10315.1 ATP synthase F0 subunit B [Candidatus Moranbacteria bacterium]
MQELISTFHIDIKLIIAQLVNFAIVLFVLKRYAYGPMMKLMNERSEKIEKGIADAEESQKRLAEITQKEKEVLVEARKTAQEIVAKAEAVAVKNKEEIVVEAKAQAEKILADSAKKIELEKNQMMQEVKGQIAELVVAATRKLIDEKMTSEKDTDLIAKAIR